MFSAGIIINEILTREKPYARELKGTSPALVFQQVCNNGLRPRMQPPKQDGYTDGMNSIVFDCLHPNPTLRPSFKTIGVSRYHTTLLFIINLITCRVELSY